MNPTPNLLIPGHTIVSGILAGLIFCSSCSNSRSPTDTAMFRDDATHDIPAQTGGILNKPKIRWQFRSGGPITSTALVTDNDVFFTSSDSNAYCLDSHNGKLKWSFKTGGPMYSSPALDKGVLFFSSYDGNLYALNADKGTIKWIYKTDGEKLFTPPGINGQQPKADEWDFYTSAPTLEGGAIYFGTGKGNLYSLDKNNGKLNWMFKSNGTIHASPAVGYGKVYFGSWDSYFYALDKRNGKPVWKFKTGIDTVYYNQVGIQGSALIHDSMIYFGCRDAHMYALDALSGRLIWKRFHDYSWVNSTPAVFGNDIVYTLSDKFSLMIVNKKNGNIDGATLSKGYMFSSPVIAGGFAYYGDFLGFLYAADLRNGRKLWTYRSEASGLDTHHILNPDSSLNNRVYSPEFIKKESKTSMEMIFSLGGFISSPVIKDQVMYIGSADGTMYSFQ